MVKFVTYEVYSMAPNGGWYLSSRFSSDQKEEAFNLGKNIESNDGLPTKIIKETYDSENNKNENTVLYISPKIRNSKQKKHSKKYYGGGFQGEIPILLYEEENETGTSFGKIVWLFVFILMVSFILATLSAFIAVMIMSNYTDVSGEIGSKVIFSIFVFMFILTATPMSKKFIPWHKIKYADGNSGGKISVIDDENQKRASISDGMQNFIYKFLLKGFKEKPPEEKPETEEDYPFKKEQPKKESAVEKEFKSIFDNKDLLKGENPFEEEKEALTEEEMNTNKGEQTAENTEVPPEKENDALYESYKKQLMYFIKDVALNLKSEALPITAYTKFGFNLLIIGALDSIKDKDEISEKEYKSLLEESFLLLGIQPHLTDTFYEKIGSYTLNPVYLQMIHNGNDIMQAMSVGSSELQTMIISAFKEWLKPISKEHDIITVMFTDISNSTGITQEVGDEKAYGLIKTHNGIVRKALQELSGREIKHTGDGIMASFLSSENAVHAAVLIQRLALSYNKTAELPLKLKIGLSNGEPIREGQDLFGATVQVASRLCSHAVPGQILVSKEIAESNLSMTDKFVKIGEEELKGLKAPIEIYNIEYEQEKTEEDANDETVSIEAE